MNGLTYIRTRCNISQSELADILQVSKQAISMWENGKKEIPPGRRVELARFFGIGEEFFGEISKEQKEAVLRRAMFRHDVGGREAYRFRPEDGVTSLSGIPMLFLQEGEQSFDERYVEAQKRKKRTLEEISAMIDGKPCDFLDGMTMSIHSGCNMYDFMTRLLQHKDQQARCLKVPFRYELLNILLAMELAYDVEGDLEARRREYCADDSVVHCDEQFILQMAALMRQHWNQQREYHQGLIGQGTRSLGEQTLGQRQAAEEFRRLPLEEQVRMIEEENARCGGESKGVMVL